MECSLQGEWTEVPLFQNIFQAISYYLPKRNNVCCMYHIGEDYRLCNTE